MSEASWSFARQALYWLALTAVTAGQLSGCARPPPPTPAKRVTALPPPPAVLPHLPTRPRPVPLPARKPVPPPEPRSPASADEAVAMIVPQPSQNAAPPAYPTRSKELIGLDQKAAVRLFGSAQEKSEKPPATVWRWRSGTCELDLYFYLDLRNGEMRSLHYVFKGDATGQQDCLKSLALATRG